MSNGKAKVFAKFRSWGIIGKLVIDGIEGMEVLDCPVGIKIVTTETLEEFGHFHFFGPPHHGSGWLLAWGAKSGMGSANASSLLMI